jgi:hypothetical protein
VLLQLTIIRDDGNEAVLLIPASQIWLASAEKEGCFIWTRNPLEIDVNSRALAKATDSDELIERMYVQFTRMMIGSRVVTANNFDLVAKLCNLVTLSSRVGEGASAWAVAPDVVIAIAEAFDNGKCVGSNVVLSRLVEAFDLPSLPVRETPAEVVAKLYPDLQQGVMSPDAETTRLQ